MALFPLRRKKATEPPPRPPTPDEIFLNAEQEIARIKIDLKKIPWLTDSGEKLK